MMLTELVISTVLCGAVVSGTVDSGAAVSVLKIVKGGGVTAPPDIMVIVGVGAVIVSVVIPHASQAELYSDGSLEQAEVA